MANIERVTVTLPNELIKAIDRREKNRSKFVAEAVRRELDRRRRAEMRMSLDNPHPESADMAELGFDDWAGSLPVEAAASLVDMTAGKPVLWIPGQGWVEGRK